MPAEIKPFRCKICRTEYKKRLGKFVRGCTCHVSDEQIERLLEDVLGGDTEDESEDREADEDDEDDSTP